MPNDSFVIKSLDFTKCVGIRGKYDETFTDVITYGEFPFNQKIQKIQEIKVYSDMDDPDSAVIVGLKVTYKLQGEATALDVPHGIVNTHVDELYINDHERLVGVYGQLKDLKDSTKNGRVATISFVLFDEKNATLLTKGPFPNPALHLGKVWGNFGDVIAFHGSKADEVGLTSLGFVNIMKMVHDYNDDLSLNSLADLTTQ